MGYSGIELRGISQYKNASMIFTTEKEIEQQILTENPRIKSVTVEKIFPQTIYIKITKNDLLTVLKSGNGYFYLDETGKIIEKTKELKKNLPVITYYQMFDYYSYSAGDLITYQDFLASLQILKTLLDLGIQIDTIDISSLSMILLQVGNKQIIFTTEKDIKTQLYEVEKIVQRFKIEGKEFQSLDVRFDKPVVIY
jgi:hypothetical protein